ncbi:tetratricopeptide repeat protein [Candidatus Phycosocius spiralis]|uniref:tetratricopeptide repeat protein n=1 Tax=Candidatus Phycosocius spiralis TaxID=2815099 RepID=UPI0024E0525D|nr:tetratricopeptide repeat protein [Candidatus Phycosocius spiralis]
MFKAFIRHIIACLGLISLTSVAVAQTPTGSTNLSEPAANIELVRALDVSIFAATLAGRYGEATDNSALAAQAWSRAYARQPSDRVLLQRAVQANGEIGDIGAIIRLSRLAPAGIRPPLAVLALATEAFAQGRYHDVTRLLSKRDFPYGQDLFAQHLRACALLALGQVEQATELTKVLSDDGDYDQAAMMSHAILLTQAKKYQEALGIFQMASKNEQATPSGIRAYTNLLMWQNRQGEAIELLRPLALGSSSKATQFQGTLKEAQKGIKAQPLRNHQTTATLGLLSLVEGLEVARLSPSNGSELLFLVAHLNPQSQEVSFALGQALAAGNKADLAAGYLRKVQPSSPDYVAAQIELTWMAFSKDPEFALDQARALARTNPAFATQTLLADMLAANHQDREAEATYDQLINESEAAGRTKRENWPLYFGRGCARERLGRWSEALPDLRTAQASAPNQPNVLNYLGYALADRGENLDEALALLRTATRLRPRSGEIADSYGWALYRIGRYEEAASLLERAVSLSPNVSEITEHLGDVYWRTSRHIEARLEWSRAYNQSTKPAQKNALEVKLSQGLTTDPTQAAAEAIAAMSQLDVSVIKYPQ